MLLATLKHLNFFCSYMACTLLLLGTYVNPPFDNAPVTLCSSSRQTIELSQVAGTLCFELKDYLRK